MCFSLCCRLCPYLFIQLSSFGIIIPDDIFYDTFDQIQLIRSKKRIDEKWKKILEDIDGTKAFIQIFGDVFQNAILKYPDSFITGIDDHDILCRMVKVKTDDPNRFIPTNAAAVNRWNPPGKIFLYMSYGKETKPYNKDLNLCEYVCLLQCRTEPNTDCSFCRFYPTTKGRILDLSYNAVELSLYSRDLASYRDIETQQVLNRIFEKYRKSGNSEDIEKIASQELMKNDLSDEYLTVNIAKQVLVMICNAIYKKVDENKDEEYRSFHILADYLIRNGITGIIYPCTRTKDIHAKNIVLFNVSDAMPRGDTIDIFIMRDMIKRYEKRVR